MGKNFVEELRWRGMLHDCTPGTEEQLNREMTTAYIGFDPTAASLHVGNLATIMLLVHFQQCGHRPMALVGGATGMVGDPSGKSEERKFLDEDTLRHNQAAVKAQLEHFLDFGDAPNAARMVNNYDWIGGMGFLEFLREAGKYLTVNYMMAKDSVRKRLETGISFTEFSYQLVQGYDFYHLYKNQGVKLQMGGSDQWGNITTGTELIRRKLGRDEADAFALTTPLLTKADGSKFGKSESGNVWLEAQLTSPYKFYQFWLNAADEDAKKLVRVFTLLDRPTVERLEAEHQADPGKRLLQKTIAEDVTVRVHGRAAYEGALNASQILFGNASTEALQALDAATLAEVLDGVPQVKISAGELAATASVVDLLSVATQNVIFPSKGEARKMLQAGGVSVNKTKIDEKAVPADFALLHGRYLLVRRGKNNYFLVEVG
jgi:tyrosyl-tRNA synthetase